MMIRATAFFCLLTTSATAETPRVEMVHGDRFVIIDGDTVALPCRQPDCTGPERIRIMNIDAHGPAISRGTRPCCRQTRRLNPAFCEGLATARRRS